MNPVRIRYYGLFPLTKRTYLIVQALVFVILFVLLLWVLSLPANPRFGLDDARLNPVTRWMLDHLLLIVLVTGGLEILDTLFTVRAFARKEAAQRAAVPGS